MNHYPKHIGDWRVATGKLTRVQRDIYTELIDTYYDKEAPLTGDFDLLAEDHGIRTVEEKDALRYVLRRFFVADGGVFRHPRCDEEIEHFHRIVEAGRKAGKASGSARAAKRAERKGNGSGTTVQRGSNVEPTTGEPPKTQDPLSSPDGEGGGSAASPTPPAPTPTPAPTPAPEKLNRPARKAPKDFKVTKELVDWAREKANLLTDDDIRRETEMFRNHTFGRAISDWPATWKNWLLKEQKFRESRQPQPRMNGPAADRRAKVDSFRAAVMGESNAASKSGTFVDVESRVVRDGEE